MSLKVKDKQLLKNYNKIWKRIEKLIDLIIYRVQILTANLLMVMMINT